MKIRYILAIAILMGASIARASLVSEWAAGTGVNTNGATVWTDSVSGNNLGFYSTGGLPGDLVDVTGQSFDKAYSFGGLRYGARELPSYFAGLTDVSVAMWFNVNDLNSNYILWSDGGGASGYSMSVSTNGAIRGLLKAGASTGADSDINITGGTVSAGSWYHVAMTIDGANDEMRLYLNGSMIVSETNTVFGDFTGANHVAIGAKNFSAMGGADATDGGDLTDDASSFSTLAGQVSLVQLYDNELSGEDVSNLYAIPEPAAIGMIISAGVGILFVRRRFMM